jgi:cation diffusion facilitator CzcD-associated flavoprotein CzcO
MQSTDVAILGAGQSGLAMSRVLAQRGFDHVVFERRSIADRWQNRTWESLRLLTPNWLNTLPGLPYDGPDPDGFMTRDDFVRRLKTYAARFCAPVLANTRVGSIEQANGGFVVRTDGGAWQARAVVVATGQCDKPAIPGMAQSIDRSVASVHACDYRSPAELAPGAVLVVGASASGVQIADEVRRAGREVILSVGRHTRLPRTWRGRDIFWWLDRMGVLAERTRDLADPVAAMRQPSLQLAGRPDRSNVDLATLQAIGVRTIGRVVAAEGDQLSVAPDLAESVRAAEKKQRRLLAAIDAYACTVPSLQRPQIAAVSVDHEVPVRLSLRAEKIGTIVWATGYRRSFPWLPKCALAPDGEFAHSDGISPIPGLYGLGFRLLRKRDSSFIGGIGTDAIALGRHVADYLNLSSRRCA